MLYVPYLCAGMSALARYHPCHAAVLGSFFSTSRGSTGSALLGADLRANICVLQIGLVPRLSVAPDLVVLALDLVVLAVNLKYSAGSLKQACARVFIGQHGLCHQALHPCGTTVRPAALPLIGMDLCPARCQSLFVAGCPGLTLSVRGQCLRQGWPSSIGAWPFR